MLDILTLENTVNGVNVNLYFKRIMLTITGGTFMMTFDKLTIAISLSVILETATLFA